MRWLLIGNSLSPAAGEALKRFGHTVYGLADAELLADAGPEQILEAAAKKQWDILTTGSDLADFPFQWHRKMTRCMVYLQLAGGEMEQDDAIDRLFARYKRLTPGRLYTVTETRVKVRQFPTVLRERERESSELESPLPNPPPEYQERGQKKFAAKIPGYSPSKGND